MNVVTNVSVYFCNNKCEKGSKQNQKLCQFISDLQQQYRDKILSVGTCSTTLTVTHFSPVPKFCTQGIKKCDTGLKWVNENREVASLVGEWWLLNFYLNDQPSTLLLDSGAQVSIINKEEFAKNLPDVNIEHIS